MHVSTSLGAVIRNKEIERIWTYFEQFGSKSKNRKLRTEKNIYFLIDTFLNFEYVGNMYMYVCLYDDITIWWRDKHLILNDILLVYLTLVIW